jgi:hypothetical protein
MSCVSLRATDRTMRYRPAAIRPVHGPMANTAAHQQHRQHGAVRPRLPDRGRTRPRLPSHAAVARPADADPVHHHHDHPSLLLLRTPLIRNMPLTRRGVNGPLNFRLAARSGGAVPRGLPFRRRSLPN